MRDFHQISEEIIEIAKGIEDFSDISQETFQIIALIKEYNELRDIDDMEELL